MPTGAFITQVDSEQISIASRSGNILTLAASGARGYNSTDATDHDQGSGIAEIQTEYVYKVADHPVKALNAVYVDNVRQTSGFTAYTGQSGDEKTGYEGKAVIVFDTLPVFLKQVNVAIDDTIGVSDGIGVSDTIGVSTGNHGHTGTESIIVWPFDSADTSGGSPTYQQHPIDNNMVTQAGFRFAGDKVDISTAQYKSFSGAPTQYRLGIKMVADGGGNVRFTFNGDYINITAVGTVQSSWIDVDSASDTWAEFNNLVGYVECTSAGAST
ncbi:MAG: hypothetical protein GY771_01055, partial [bacterium]|nr:hypothetical protein [bacterium]